LRKPLNISEEEFLKELNGDKLDIHIVGLIDKKVVSTLLIKKMDSNTFKF